MSGFVVDWEEQSEGAARLGAALSGVAQSDAPLFVEIVIVDEEEIRRLNRELRQVDRVTDVLSFPAMDSIKDRPVLSEEHGEELDEEGRLYLGSVAICETRAREQAEEYGHSYERELYYLAVHGILHCLGYDHETEREKSEMRAKEEEILKNMNLTRDV